MLRVGTHTFLISLVGIFFVHFVRFCGSRTASEVLFCNSPKKYPKKAATSATPRKKHGVPTYPVALSCCARTHPR